MSEVSNLSDVYSNSNKMQNNAHLHCKYYNEFCNKCGNAMKFKKLVPYFIDDDVIAYSVVNVAPDELNILIKCNNKYGCNLN